MARLLLKFESEILREIPIGKRPVTIGRAPDNDLAIDNLAVSDHHARLYAEGDRLVIEDLSSLNGTFVNDVRIERTTLRDGDTILIGKHQIQVDATHDAAVPVAGWRKAPAPKIDETAVLDTREQRELLRQTAAAGPGVGSAVSSGKLSLPSRERLRSATLRVLRGRTDKHEYVLAGKLTVIGRSEMASVRLTGWFAPPVAAQINHRADGYYLGLGDRVPKVNGQPIQGPTRLHDGDIIELGRVRLHFSSPRDPNDPPTV
jgi:pSer/pThr/pTyr-binding forkhead associated (FHA) protein